MLKLRCAAFATTAATCLIPASPAAADPWGTHHCAPGWHFEDIKLLKTKQVVVETARFENTSRKRTHATFTSTKSMTEQIQLGAEFSGGVDAILVSVHGAGEVSATKSVTAQIGVQYTAPVPGRRTAVGTYGAFVRPVKGTLEKGNKYSRCIVRERIKVKVPVGTGWRHHYEQL